MKAKPFKHLWSYLYHWSNEQAEQTALHFEDKKMTYREVEIAVNQVARSLWQKGIRPGDRIATILPSRPEFLVSYLASSQLGAILVPFDVRYKSADLQRFIKHIEPSLIISVDQSKDHQPAKELRSLPAGTIREEDCYFIGDAAWGQSYADLLVGETTPDPAVVAQRKQLGSDIANLIIFTGGTTGRPKPAVLSAKNVVAMAECEEAFIRDELKRAGHRGRIASLAALPPSHVGGCVEIIGTGLLGGYELYFQEHWSPSEVLRQTADAKIPWIGGVPTMYQILLQLPDLNQYDLSGLYLALASGEKLPLDLIRAVREKLCPRLINGYGSTEAGPEICFTRPEDPPEALAEGYAGLPLPGVELLIVDESGAKVADGQIGEVLVRSDFTIREYYRMPEENAEGFTVDGFCRTGDWGYLNSSGGLYLQGRKKHIIRVGSYTVVPSEVEEVALALPELAMAVSLGAPHPIYQEVVWLFVVLQEGATLSEAEVSEFISERLANYKVPKRVIFRNTLPQTRIGKADWRALQQEMEAIDWVVDEVSQTITTT